MIQRIQTLYILVALLISIILILIWKPISITGLVIICSIILSLTSIFSYKKRQFQFVLGRLNILSNLILLGLLIYESLSLPGETSVSVKGIEVLLPFISIVFIVLANKAIQKDENLVKSVDRIR